jgi:DNA polymerase-3 subunit epsilon
MRQIILDTETTGLEVSAGHRIIEVAAIEMVNREKTGKFLHFYLNPERVVDEGAIKIHGITNEFLKDKPKFKSIAEELLNFIRGAELLIHNAPFDLGFMNREFLAWDRNWAGVTAHCGILDTLVMARSKHRGARNSLDALCKRYKINSAHRHFHGALLDSELLADVYLAMTGGQINLWMEGTEQSDDENDEENSAEKVMGVLENAPAAATRVVYADEPELAAHKIYLDALEKPSGGKVLWKKLLANVTDEGR